jgi:hypothetical protein
MLKSKCGQYVSSWPAAQMKVTHAPQREENTMTRFKSLVVESLLMLVIGSGTLATNLQAQSDKVAAIVPFPFTVGTQSFAPGTYEFSLVSSQFLLSVLNMKTGEMEMFDVRPERQRTLEQHGRLLFRESEGGSILNEVHFLGDRTFTEVVQRHGAGRIEAKNSSPEISIFVAQR